MLWRRRWERWRGGCRIASEDRGVSVWFFDKGGREDVRMP
jgi:hypothetical protein